MPRVPLGLLGLALTLAAPSARATTMFTGLGVLPGTTSSFATGVSADGSVVVGQSLEFTSVTGRAFRWTTSTGMTELPGSSEGLNTDAYAVSSDGSVAVGAQWDPEVDQSSQAVRWPVGEGAVGLGFLPTDPDWCCASIAYAVSADGSVVVGESTVGSTHHEAFRWSAETGMVGLGMLPGDVESLAFGASADGSIIVGYSENQEGQTFHLEAFRWSEATGMIGIGQLPGADWSAAWGVSADGSVIVGKSGNEAFRWTEATGMEGVGTLPGDTSSSALAVSADGSVVVGLSCRGLEGDTAFIWDPVHGIRSLRDLLVNEYDLDLTGWMLRGASGISADGRTIVGYGLDPSGRDRAWVAVLPEPSAVLQLATGLAGTVACRRALERANRARRHV